MIRATSTRRLMSILLSAAMLLPVCASAAEAAVANWLSPLPGQQITNRYVEVSIGYNTQSSAKVTRVELWVDGKLYTKKDLVNPDTRGVCSFSWDTAKFSSGPHDLVVKIYSGSELLCSVSGNGSVGGGGGNYDVTPPTVTFANIKPGDTLKGHTDIVLKANDNSGEAPLVSLLVDNSLRLLENQPPYTYNLDTTTYNDGDHELKTCAFDTAGNRSDDTVIKVSFKNGVSRPVVAALSIDSAPIDLTKLDEGASDPVVPVESSAQETTDTAARMIDSNAMVITAGTAATSIAAQPEAKVGRATQEKVSAPAVSAEPTRVAAAVDSGALRSETQNAGSSLDSGRAVEPKITSDAAIADVSSTPASTLPQSKQLSAEPLAMTNTAVEPAGTSDAAVSDVTRMALAPELSLRVDGQLSGLSMEASASEEKIFQPSVADVSNIVASSPASGIKGVEETLLALGNPSMPEPAKVGASSAEPKRVQVAMLPELRNSKPRVAMGGIVVTPPAIKKEKESLPAKSSTAASVKLLRDMIAEQGGFICWDHQNHSTVAYVNNMCIELTIGSNSVMVNGLPMTIEFSPEVINGRTLVDARLYQMALTLVEKGSL